MDRKTFDAKRSEARAQTGTLKALYQELANAAISHFQVHGDTSYIADLYSDMKDSGKNFIRSVSFIKWLTNFAPIKIVEKRFVKDKAREAEIWPTKEAAAKMVEMASKVAFWDFDPETAIVNFEFADLLKAMAQLVKRFENTKHMKPKDAEATEALGRVKNFVNLLTKPVANDETQSEAPEGVVEANEEAAPAQAEAA